MKTLLTICLALVCLGVKAQRFYVEKADNNSEQPIINKLLSSNFKIAFNRDSADYIILCDITGKSIDMARGSISILSKNGDLLAKSKEVRGQAMVWNGYANPKRLSMQKIADGQLINLVTKLK